MRDFKVGDAVPFHADARDPGLFCIFVEFYGTRAEAEAIVRILRLMERYTPTPQPEEQP